MNSLVWVLFFWQGSDASATSRLRGSGSSCTQKAERTEGGRRAQSANQHSINGYAFFRSWSLVRILVCVFQCCLLHRMASPPMQEWGRSGDLCYSLIGWSNWPAFLVYVFCLSLVFSLNMHLRDLPVVDVCCGAVSFDLSPWLWIMPIQNYC